MKLRPFDEIPKFQFSKVLSPKAFVSLSLLLLFGAACASPVPAPTRDEAHETYRVGASDSLQIIVLPEPEVERTVTVRLDGKISMDLIGDVQAAGKTTVEIGEEIQNRILRFKRDARVTVYLVDTQATQVTILGETNAMSFPLDRDTRLVEAIGKAGGTSNLASLRKIRIVRNEGGQVHVYRANLRAIYAGDLRTNILLEPGDIIYVPPTLWTRFGYVIGQIFFPVTTLTSGITKAFIGI